jgi:hypothetical protein
MGGFISSGCKMVTNTFGNRYLMQPMRRLNVHFFFSFGFLGVGEGIFVVFLSIANVFPSSSHGVPIRFPNGFQSVLQAIPNITSISYHIIKFSLGFLHIPKFPMCFQHIFNSISIHFLAGFPICDQDVTFLCHGLYTPIKAHGLGFTKINLGHTLGYQLGVHFDNLKGWVWCILLFLMAETKECITHALFHKRMAGWWCLSLTSKLDLI